MTELQWIPRAVPLRATAAVGSGEVASALRARLLRLDDDALCALRGVSAGDTLVILGEADALPWADGVEYLGVDAHAPTLLLPTTWQPAGHASLAARALLRVANEPGAPWAVVRRDRRLISTASARPLARPRLARWRQS